MRSFVVYEVLKSYGILQFLLLLVIKQFIFVNYQFVGIICNFEYLQEVRKLYIVYIEERVEQGYLKLMYIGVVIFDEVKVVMKVYWNSVDNG